MNVLGIDIGGSGIKGAVVDTAKGRLITERVRIDTPDPATPAAVCRTIAAVARRFGWRGPIGVGFPGIIRGGIVNSAANLDPAWRGRNLRAMVSKATRCSVHALNDADAAGVAEAAFGAGRKKRGTLLLLTLGTGIGSALIHNGVLVPNTEFGHLQFRGGAAEDYAAASARKNFDLPWSRWAKRVNHFLLHLDFLLSPDLIIIGGGVSGKFAKIAPHLDDRLTVVPAKLRNEAGIIGAALVAASCLPKSQLAVKSFRQPAG